MEVILLERIDKLGQMGDVVNVKPGYARNFLLPQKKALRATEANKKHFEAERAQLEAHNLERRSDAEKLSEKMDGATVIMVRQAGEAGQLYGSVNARDIADALTESGFTTTRQQVELPHPIKALGLYDIRVSLHPEVAVTVVANVARSLDEAKIQTRTGKAIVGAGEEQEAAPEKPAEAAPEEPAEAAEKAAIEAIAEQAEEIFEEGAAPELEQELEPETGPEDKAETDSGAPEVSGEASGDAPEEVPGDEKTDQ